jgi:hypothetical protein
MIFVKITQPDSMKGCATQLAVAIVLIAAAGCADPASKLAEIDSSVMSWSQTLLLAGNLWVNGRVPSKYLRQTLDAADEALQQQKKQLGSIQSSSANKTSLQQRTDKLLDTSKNMRQLLERNDRDQMQKVLETLAASPSTSPATTEFAQ